MRSSWHGFFRIELIRFLSQASLHSSHLVATIIKLYLLTLQGLWIKCCDLPRATLSRESQIEEVLEMRREVRDILHSEEHQPYLSPLLLQETPATMLASALRAWLLNYIHNVPIYVDTNR